MNKILEFAKEWNSWCAKTRDIHIMPIAYGNDVYQIDVRFPATEYRCNEHEFYNIVNALLNRTNGTLRAVTDLKDYHSGSLRFDVEFANQGFNEAHVASALRFLVNSAFPGFRKANNPKACF